MYDMFLEQNYSGYKDIFGSSSRPYHPAAPAQQTDEEQPRNFSQLELKLDENIGEQISLFD